MEYITATPHFPGALTDCAAAVLKVVSKSGVWMPAPADLNFDQLRALLSLRNSGYIEHASYGGYKVKSNQHTVARPPATPEARITAILAAHGLTTKCPPMVCRTALARGGGKPSYMFILASGQKIGNARAAFDEFVADGVVCVVTLKEG